MGAVEAVIDILLGLGASAYGTLIGAGGGFLMSPALLLVFNQPPQVAAGTSLTAVVFNAATAVLTYHQQGRIDYYTGVRFAAATIPTAVLGSLIVPYMPDRAFKLIFGLVLVLIASYLALRGDRPAGRPAGFVADEAGLRAEGKTVRKLTDASGITALYGYRMRDGLLLSAGVGLMSSLLGVGGGIIHTPAMITLFAVPAHVAVATSQFILLISAATGAVSYLVRGHVDLLTAIALGIGGIIGARLGAAIARRVKGRLIVRLLAVALLAVGARLIAGGLGVL
jgi:uncharacterized membrane protein YfcA